MSIHINYAFPTPVEPYTDKEKDYAGRSLRHHLSGQHRIYAQSKPVGTDMALGIKYFSYTDHFTTKKNISKAIATVCGYQYCPKHHAVIVELGYHGDEEESVLGRALYILGIKISTWVLLRHDTGIKNG